MRLDTAHTRNIKNCNIHFFFFLPFSSNQFRSTLFVWMIKKNREEKSFVGAARARTIWHEARGSVQKPASKMLLRGSLTHAYVAFSLTVLPHRAVTKACASRIHFERARQTKCITTLSFLLTSTYIEHWLVELINCIDKTRTYRMYIDAAIKLHTSATRSACRIAEIISMFFAPNRRIISALFLSVSLSLACAW